MSTDNPRPHQPGAVIGVIGLVIAAAWAVGATVAAFALIGAGDIAALPSVQMAALVAAIVLPALMAVFSGLAARDSARARAEAARLADAADRLMNPERSAEEAARQLAASVRGEIGALDKALENTLGRLRDVEAQIAQQARTVDDMASQAKAGAETMISGMEREREELLRISRELNQQAQTIGASISRHTQSITEAARVAEAEVRAADQALDHRLTSFGAAAALINDRTHGLSNAAQASADSALRLETALSNALDILAKATSLTDAARQSAEAATLAANSTAGAVRDTTVRAIDDAKRAADLIRNEAVGVEREAAIALERLREAADAARAAAIGAREAAEDERTPRAPRRAPAPPRDTSTYDASWRTQSDPLEQPRQRREPPTPAQSEAMFGERPNERVERTPPADWTWRDLLSSVDAPEQQAAHAAPRREAEDPVAHLRRQISQPRGQPPLPIVATIERAGLRLDDAFSPSALERIAQRARSGTQARRRAVFDAAPDAAGRLADLLAHDAQANQEAMQFLRNDGARIAELIGRGRASMTAEATRAFLLIDAAAG